MNLHYLRSVQNKREKNLEDWLRPIYDEYYEKINIYWMEKPELVVLKNNIPSDEPAFIVHPKMVRKAKKDRTTGGINYSGRISKLPWATILKQDLAKKIITYGFYVSNNPFFTSKNPSFTEGVSDKISLEAIQKEPFGKDCCCFYASKFLVEANSFGFLKCKNIQSIKIPYDIKFEEEHYEKIQFELDYFWRNKEKLSKNLCRLDNLLFGHLSISAKGFAELMNHPNTLSQFLDSVKDLRRRNLGFGAN